MAQVQFQRIELLERRLDALVSRETFDKAGHRIGMFLAAQMKMRAIKQNIKDSSDTINSINYKIRNIAGKTVVEAGVYGVFYARFHEYGTQNLKGTSPNKILGMILKNYEKLGRLNRPSKGVFDKKTGRLRERPFVRPALEDNMKTIVRMLREEMDDASR
jgi:HK97 gp10 family phage protein